MKRSAACASSAKRVFLSKAVAVFAISRASKLLGFYFRVVRLLGGEPSSRSFDAGIIHTDEAAGVAQKLDGIGG
jgi:hypothetical protein